MYPELYLPLQTARLILCDFVESDFDAVQAYATEAARTTVRVGFERLSLAKIIATCEGSNTVAAHALEKVGLLREMVLPKYKEAKERWREMYIYAIVRSERQQGFVSRAPEGEQPDKRPMRLVCRA